jgi:hypothetical protein
MAIPNPQPTLPAEGVYTESERLFIAEEPLGLFPGNQNSNWGLLRGVLTDEIEIIVGQLNALFNEMFIETSSALLTNWEEQAGIPNGSGFDDGHRRTSIESRRIRAPFTRTRRKELVERYIGDTFGTPASFDGSGISLVGGIPLHSTTGVVTSFYSIIEDVENFSYEVQISNSVDPDITGLTRELAWMTPAHISFTITRY